MESVLSLNGGSDLKVPLIPREGDEEIGRPSEATAAAPVSSSHKLGFGALVFLIYYNIGVPFGDEEVCMVQQQYSSSSTGRLSQYCCMTTTPWIIDSGSIGNR